MQTRDDEASAPPRVSNGWPRRTLAYWWLPVVLLALVFVAALAQFAQLPPRAVTAQSFDVAVVPTGPATSYDAYVASYEAASVAGYLASGQLLASAAFQGGVRDQLAAAGTSLDGAQPQQLTDAIQATHQGSRLTLTVHWRSAQGAQSLLASAAQVLAQQAPRSELSPGATIVFQATGPASAPTDEGRVARFAWGGWGVRAALALVAGVLLAVAAGGISAGEQARVRMMAAHSDTSTV